MTDIAAVGELGLDGTTRPVRGVLPVARTSPCRGITLIVPPDNVRKAQLVSEARRAGIVRRSRADLRRGAARPFGTPA